MPETEKTQVSIYQIETAFFQDDTFEEVTDKIIKTTNDKGENYKSDKLSKEDFGEFKVRLYYQTKNNKPRWRGFLKKILAEDAAISTLMNRSHSFLLFIEYSDKIYAISGGTGSLALDNFVTQTFGIDILTRLIEKNSQVIKHVQQRGVTGNLLGQTRFYRGDQRLSDENEFGKIFKEVKADLNQKILKKTFGFKDIELTRKSSGCLAKTSFQINKMLDFDAFLRIIKKITVLLNKEPNFTINSVELIKGKHPDTVNLLSRLKESLVQTLYEHYENETESDFDFCHIDFEKYLTALHYIISDSDSNQWIRLDEAIKLNELFKVLKKKHGANVDEIYTFKAFILDTQEIVTQDDNGGILTRDNVLNHIHGEINYNGSSYFLIDKQWYKINPAFITELNDSCKDLFKDAWDDKLITFPFSQKTEGEFNLSFIGQQDILVLDTITSDNIEACDILKYDGNSVYLIHVKRGFNNSIRDLSAQIAIAARRLLQDRKAGYTYITDIERKAKRGRTSLSPNRQKVANQQFPKDGLKSIFEQKREINICFCLAFVDTSETNRSLKDNIEQFDSNIAKYALIELKNAIKQFGFDFKIIQLKKA